MFKKILLLSLMTSIVLSACGSINVSVEQPIASPFAATPTGAIPGGDPTRTTLEWEATSMSAFVTQQAATMIALTQAATPVPFDPSNPWKLYQNNTFGFSMEYPRAYDEAPYSDTCGLKVSNEGIHLGHQIELLFLAANNFSVEAYASKLLKDKNWTLESQRYQTVSGLNAVTVDYRFGGTNRFGTFTLVESNGLIVAFQFTAGDFCEIPGSQITEADAYAYIIGSFRFLGIQASPTPQATASLDPIYPILIYPPYDSRAGYLLGGTNKQGKWLDSTATATYLTGNEGYAIYATNALLGYSLGSLPQQSPPFCPGMQEVSLHADDPFNSIVALSAPWNALPRSSQELSTDNESYRQVIFDLLQANGIAQPDVRLTRILKVDIEGDGVDEVLISASHFAEQTGHDVTTGDYSVVVLRKVSGYTAVSVPITADYYLQSQPSSFPDKHLLTAVLDLDGDGRMEIVLSITGWEQLGASGYEIDGTTTREILQVRCP